MKNYDKLVDTQNIAWYDICRWALQENFPKKISASGNRYHFEDDWEFYDTLITSFEYDNKMITWESKSCNAMPYYGRGRGASIHGTNGTVIIDRNGYEMFDLDGKKTFEFEKPVKDETTGLVGGGPLTNAHFQNFIDAIKGKSNLNSSLDKVNTSCDILLIANIAWKEGKVLNIDTNTGQIIDNQSAIDKYWAREYEPGWEPKI